MILPIYTYGSSVLREETQTIDRDYPFLKKLIENMFETMYAAEGIGLAAPQIGRPIRLLVIDADPIKDEYPECAGFKRVFINAEILNYNDETVSLPEGCLSLPGITEKVERPTEVTVKYLDENFEEHTETFKGFAARVFQHESDHLWQTLFTDRISPLRKRMIKSRLSKMSKGQVSATYPTVLR